MILNLILANAAVASETFNVEGLIRDLAFILDSRGRNDSGVQMA